MEFIEKGDLEFKSQSEINSFGEKYSKKEKTIHGNLIIDGEGINDLRPLGTIVSVKNDLNISHTSLKNLVGLDGIDSIGGSFALRRNDYLQDMADINPIYVNSSISISNNLQLKEINTFNNIGELKGNLEIAKNRSLLEISGFEKLKTIGGNLFIGSTSPDISNDSLTDISMTNLTEVKGNFEIIWNHSLKTLEGFNKLEVVRGLVRIDINKSLQSLSGLGRIRTVKNLFIHSNASLRTLEGLNSLSYITGELRIMNNDSLVSLIGMPNLSWIGDNCWIHDNAQLRSLSGLENISYIHDLWIQFIGDGPFDFCPIKKILQNHGIKYFLMITKRGVYYGGYVIDNCN